MVDKHSNKKYSASRLKNPPTNSGSRVKLTSSYSVPVIDYPIFSFKYLVSGYGVNDCNDKQAKSDLLGKLYVMSQKTWTDLEIGNHKSGAGFEKIPRKQFKTSLPVVVTEDIDKLYSMRFNSLSSRLIGFRSSHIFHITHIDTNLSSYKHG